jgi:hypothetical protein
MARATALRSLFNCADRCSDSRARYRSDLSEISAGRSPHPCADSSRMRCGWWHTPHDSDNCNAEMTSQRPQCLVRRGSSGRYNPCLSRVRVSPAHAWQNEQENLAKHHRGFLLLDVQFPETPVPPGARTQGLFQMAGHSLPRFPGHAFGLVFRWVLPAPHGATCWR